MAQVGQLVEATDVQRVLPVATTAERRLRFSWAEPPSTELLMNWNTRMEPNSMFVETMDEHGLTVTVRWALMKESPEQIRQRLNRWLAHLEQGSYRRSGVSGRRL